MQSWPPDPGRERGLTPTARFLVAQEGAQEQPAACVVCDTAAAAVAALCSSHLIALPLQ